MPRTAKLALLSALTIVASLAAASAADAAAKLTADYRFEGNLKSKGVDAPKLTQHSSGGSFSTATIDGSENGVWTFPAGDGLRLSKANQVMGAKGDAYTFVMLVNLTTVTGYRKIVDFDDLQKEEGWYVYSQSLYPYDISAFDYSQQEIQAGTWEQIALTRNKDGLLRGYVGKKKLGEAKDRKGRIALGRDDILHFLMDDSTENTAGSVARLRIWNGALSATKIKHLGR